MHAPHFALVVALLFCVGRMWRERRELPCFVFFLALYTVLNVLPWHPESRIWSRTWGLIMGGAAFAGLLASAWELLALARTKLRCVEFRLLRLGLISLAVLGWGEYWLYAKPHANWYCLVMSLRQLAGLELLFALMLVAAYLLVEDVDVPASLRAHAILLTLLVAGQNVTDVLDPTTGLRRGAATWDSLHTFLYLWSAAVFMAWGLLLPALIARTRSAAAALRCGWSGL